MKALLIMTKLILSNERQWNLVIIRKIGDISHYEPKPESVPRPKRKPEVKIEPAESTVSFHFYLKHLNRTVL